MKKWYKIFSDGAVTIDSPLGMADLGEQIGGMLEAGETLAVAGNLGAGKTHLTQGIMLGLGSAKNALSPTFSLVHEHVDGRIPAFHFDFYRLKSLDELYSSGWEDYLAEPGVIIAEWADMFPEALPDDASWLVITHLDETTRMVELKS